MVTPRELWFEIWAGRVGFVWWLAGRKVFESLIPAPYGSLFKKWVHVLEGTFS
jgi:hypothetical protein